MERTYAEKNNSNKDLTSCKELERIIEKEQEQGLSSIPAVKEKPTFLMSKNASLVL